MNKRDGLTALVALLEREQQELANPRVESLEAIAREKHVLVNALYDAWGKRSVDATPVPQGEAEIPGLARRAQRLNKSNASLLAMHRSCCESRLGVLRGVDPGHNLALYSANGYLA